VTANIRAFESVESNDTDRIAAHDRTPTARGSDDGARLFKRGRVELGGFVQILIVGHVSNGQIQNLEIKNLGRFGSADLRSWI
jgi:hypothetical protein